MPRNSAGNYSLPLPPVVAGEVVEAAWANTTLDDIAAAITASLSREGQGGMLTGLAFADGTEGNPGVAFANAPNTGIYREFDKLGVSWAGTTVAEFNAGGMVVDGDVVTSGNALFDDGMGVMFKRADGATGWTLGSNAGVFGLYNFGTSSTAFTVDPTTNALSLNGNLTAPNVTASVVSGGQISINGGHAIYNMPDGNLGFRATADGPWWGMRNDGTLVLDLGSGPLPIKTLGVDGAYRGTSTGAETPQEMAFQAIGSYGGGFACIDPGHGEAWMNAQSGSLVLRSHDTSNGQYASAQLKPSASGGIFIAPEFHAYRDVSKKAVLSPDLSGETGLFAENNGHGFSLSIGPSGVISLWADGIVPLSFDEAGNMYRKGVQEPITQIGVATVDIFGNVSVTFARPFASTPVVTLTPVVSGVDTPVIGLTNANATSFSAKSSIASSSIHWTATGL